MFIKKGNTYLINLDNVKCIYVDGNNDYDTDPFVPIVVVCMDGTATVLREYRDRGSAEFSLIRICSALKEGKAVYEM